MVEAFTFPERLRPTRLETVCGLALGVDEQAEGLVLRGDLDARAAVEDAVRRALARPPCLVSFSGGRDSSVVLAVAAAVAHREGLALPVAVSYRFPAAPGSHEQDWQERVIAHLGLPDWERLSIGSELDAVGPVAQAVLRRHGLLWPFNAHFHAPLLERAAGGSLLTGIGGDELFGPGVWSAARARLTGRGRARLRELRSVALPLAPLVVRRRRIAARHEVRWPWLHPGVDASINGQRADWLSRTPLAWHRGVGWWWRSRSRTVLQASMRLLADAAGAQVVHPLLDPAAVGAIAAQFGARGPAGRSAAMRELFGDVLLAAVLTRGDKAHFDEAFAAEHTREFAATWDGAGVDRWLVDVERLALTWRAEVPDPRSLQLLQSVWLDTVGRPLRQGSPPPE